MRFRSHQCWFPKEVASPQDYEDAASCSEKFDRVVVADGVSTAIFSRTWARLLTRTAVVNPPNVSDHESFNAWLQPLQQEWREAIDFATVSRDWIRGPKVRTEGAQSTLLIVELRHLSDAQADTPDVNEYQLIAHAIGDCCLFVVRDGTMVQSFPMTDAAAFAAAPYVLRSIAKNADYSEKFQHLDSRCQVGDLLVICTDAIGLWAMQEYEAGNQVDWMRYWDNDAVWQADILELRARSPKDPRGRMRVDDCTLLLLQVTAEEEDLDESETKPDRSDEPFVLIANADVSAHGLLETEQSAVGELETDSATLAGSSLGETTVAGAADSTEERESFRPEDLPADSEVETAVLSPECTDRREPEQTDSTREPVPVEGSSEPPWAPEPSQPEPSIADPVQDDHQPSVWERLFGSRKRPEP